ncbi:MAG: hypothetical protein PHD02_03850 [Bacilli bacterium]|nr:hypothetical protein [Bacilli bacterium]
MKEYEYSLIVNNLEPYINYCEKNKYKKLSQTKETRELYVNENNILARVTTSLDKNKQKIILDFKDNNESDEILKNNRETLPLIIEEENKEAINSILDLLDFSFKKKLERERIIYQKDKVKFELDNYMTPVKQSVLAIEGNKKEVDLVYNELKELISKEN